MKAMLLCAGLGERLMPLTAEIPKPAFTVANRPLVWYTLRLLLSWGVHQVMVNAHHLPRILAETVRSSCPRGMTIEISFEEEILGTGGGLRKVGEWFDDDPFIIVNGDILTDMDIAGAVDLHLAHEAVATMILSTNASLKSLGEVKVDRVGRVRSILSGPHAGGGDLVPAFFTGIHVMSRRVFDFIPDRPRSCLVRDLYSRMVQENRGVFGFIMDSYWRDIGTPTAYLAANIDVLDGKYRPPFELDMPSEERGPCLIGRGARVGREVRIGPYAVIGEGAVIEDRCSIRESVVWPDVTVPSGSDLVRAVVGKAVSVTVD